jgi:hypothetical protein
MLRLVVTAFAFAVMVPSASADIMGPPTPLVLVHASSTCGCIVQYTHWYTHNSYNVRGRVLSRMAKRIPFKWRDRFNKGVYDYEKGGYGTKKGWCKRNLKACRAVIACVAAAGGYLINAPKVESQRTRARGAAKNCALAATAAFLTP